MFCDFGRFLLVTTHCKRKLMYLCILYSVLAKTTGSEGFKTADDTHAPPREDHCTMDHLASLASKEINEKASSYSVFHDFNKWIYYLAVTVILTQVVLVQTHYLWNIYAQKTGCMPMKMKIAAENKLSPHMEQMKSVNDGKVTFSEGTQHVDVQGNVVNFTINNGIGYDKRKKKRKSCSCKRKPIIKLHSCNNRHISKNRWSSESGSRDDSDIDSDDDKGVCNILKCTQAVPVQETNMSTYYGIREIDNIETVISVDSNKTRPAGCKIAESLNNGGRWSIVCQSTGSEEDQRISEIFHSDNGHNIDYQTAFAGDKSIIAHVAVETNALPDIVGNDHERLGDTHNNQLTSSKSVIVSSLLNNNSTATRCSNLESAGTNIFMDEPYIFKSVRLGHGKKSFRVNDELLMQTDASVIPDPDLQSTHSKQVYGRLHHQEPQRLSKLLDAKISDCELSICSTSNNRKNTAGLADELKGHDNIGYVMETDTFKELEAMPESNETAPPKDILCERSITGTYVSDIATRTSQNLEFKDTEAACSSKEILDKLYRMQDIHSLNMELLHESIGSSRPYLLDKVGNYKQVQDDYLKTECTLRSFFKQDTCFIEPETDIVAYSLEPNGQAITGYDSLLLLSATSFAVSSAMSPEMSSEMLYGSDYYSHRDFKQHFIEDDKSVLTNKLTSLTERDSAIANQVKLQERLTNSNSDPPKHPCTWFCSLGHQAHATSDDMCFSKIHRKENHKSCYTELYLDFSLIKQNYTMDQNHIAGTCKWRDIMDKQREDVMISFEVTKALFFESSHLYNTSMDSGIASLEDTPSDVCMSKLVDTYDITDIRKTAGVHKFPFLCLLEKSTIFFSNMTAKSVQDKQMNWKLLCKIPLISKQTDTLNLVDLELTQFTKALVREIHPRHGSFLVTPRFFVLDRYFNMFGDNIPPTREEQLRFEWLRLATFSNYQGNGNALALARNGFYHDCSQGPNATRCIYCGVTHSMWELFDDIIAAHHQLSPNCPLLNNSTTEANISINENKTPTASGAPVSETSLVPVDDTLVMLQSISVSKLQQMGGEGAVVSGDTLQSERVIQQPTQDIESHGESNLLSTQRLFSSFTLTGTHSMVLQHNIARVPTATSVSTNETTMTPALSNAMIQRQQLMQPSSPGTFANSSHPPGNFSSMKPAVHKDLSVITTPAHQNRAISSVTSSQIGATSTVTSTQIGALSNATSSQIWAISTATFSQNRAISTAISSQIWPICTTTSSQIGPMCTATATQTGTATAVASMQLKSESGYAHQIADSTAGVVVANSKHPDYSSMEARINSYIGWPEYLDQTPRQMAEAGFFFVGVADFTRCFACGGGLRSWAIGDDPVLEHTRWFPRCEYVNQLKGERYVQAVERRHREHMARQQGRQDEMSERKAALQTSLDAVNTRAGFVLKDMGYSKEKICETVNTVQQQTGLLDISPEQALDWILADEDRSKTTSQTRSTGVSASTNNVMKTQMLSASASSSTTTAAALMVENKHSSTTSGSNDTKQSGRRKKKKGKSSTKSSVSLMPLSGTLSEQNIGPQSIVIENERLKERQTCKICMEQQVNTTFLPCGHLITCESCAKRLKKCAICRTKIQNTIKIFMS